jgi:hypothetical protein
MRAAAQVVAIGEAAGNDDQIDIGDVGVGLPHRQRRLSADLGQGGDHVAVAVQTGEEDDGGFHSGL